MFNSRNNIFLFVIYCSWWLRTSDGMGWGTLVVICLAVSFQGRIVATCYVKSKRVIDSQHRKNGAWIASLAATLARSRATARTDSAISKPTTSRIWLSVTRIVTSPYLTRWWRVHSQLARFLQLYAFKTPVVESAGEGPECEMETDVSNRSPQVRWHTTSIICSVRKKIKKDDPSRGTVQTPSVSDRWHPENQRVWCFLCRQCHG